MLHKVTSACGLFYVFTEQITFILSNAVLIYNLENAST